MFCATTFRSPVNLEPENLSEEEERETVIMDPVDEDTDTCSTITAIQSDNDEGSDHFHNEHTIEFIDDGAAHDSQRILSQSQHSQLNFIKEKICPSAQKRNSRRTVLPVMPCGSTTTCCSPVLPVISVLWEFIEHPQIRSTVEYGAVCDGRPLRLTYVYEVRRRNVPVLLRAMRFGLSRLHCEVLFHFRRADDDPESPYKWTSFDVVDCSSSNGTHCSAVPLLPLHRYSIRAKEVSGSVVLRFGDIYRLTITIPNGLINRSEVSAETVGAPKGIDAAVQCSAPALPPLAKISPQTTTCTDKKIARSKTRRSSCTQSKKAPRSYSTSSSCGPQASAARRKKSVTIVDETETFVSSQCAQSCVTVVTTGMRITATHVAKLRRLNINVNPDPSEFHFLTYLVIDGPLVRSIKLLSALPYAQHIVNREWMTAVLTSSVKTVDPNAFRYTEDRTRISIETVNDFSLSNLMETPPEQRQTLLSGDIFWIHPDTSPQEPPGNDIRSVILASGGAVTSVLAEANIVLMPQLEPTPVMWRRMKGFELCGEDCRFIVPDNLYRSVLQQCRPHVSTVRKPSRHIANSLTISSSIKRWMTCSPDKTHPKRRLS